MYTNVSSTQQTWVALAIKRKKTSNTGTPQARNSGDLSATSQIVGSTNKAWRDMEADESHFSRTTRQEGQDGSSWFPG